MKNQSQGDQGSEIEQSELPIAGLCGLVKRPSLDAPDLGFAFLPRFERRGYGAESAAAVIEHAKTQLGLSRLLAITTLDNEASIALLHKLGFEHRRVIDENGAKLNLLELALDPSGFAG